jgi:hypothetical protein
MIDDLFEFLAVQEMGRAAEVARRATEEAQLPAEVRSIIERIKTRHGDRGQRKWMRDLQLGSRRLNHIALSSWTSRCGYCSVLRSRAGSTERTNVEYVSARDALA